MLDLEPIKARVAAATPGPWRYVGNTVYIDPEHAREPRWWALPGDWETAALIAHAPDDLAALVAEVERLRVERDKARAVVCFQVEAAKLDGYRPGYHAKIPWLAMLEVKEAHEAAKRGA